MKKYFYVYHRWLGIVACLAILLWSVSGFFHPIMVWTQPQPARIFTDGAPLDADALRVSLADALTANNIGVIKNFRIVDFDKGFFYQVEKPGAATLIYLNAASGESAANADERYAVHLARWFTGDETSEIASVRLLTEFGGDYPSVNRLLPVYEVRFDRADGMRAFVETSSSRLGTLVDNRKAWFAWAFTSLHNLELTALPEPARTVLKLALMLAVFLTAASGIAVYLCFWSSFKNRAHEAATRRGALRRYHRTVGILVSLFALLWSASGAFHATTKLVPDDRHLSAANDAFTPADFALPLERLLRETAPAPPLVNVSLIRMARGAYYRATYLDGTVRYVHAQTGAEAIDGEQRYARTLAARFAGVADDAIVSTESVNSFDGEYGFINKRLPVVRVRFDAPNHERLYVETSSGTLAARVSDKDVIEGYSFAALHKWHYVGEAFGATTRDLLMMALAFLNTVVAALGLWLFRRGAGHGTRRRHGAGGNQARLRQPVVEASPENAVTTSTNSKRARVSPVVILIFSLSILFAGCSSTPDTATNRPPTRRFELQGVVTDVDKQARRVTVRHEAIPGYMDGMTMPFAVRDAEICERVIPGDRIQAALVVADDREYLTDVDISAPSDLPRAPRSPAPAVSNDHGHHH